MSSITFLGKKQKPWLPLKNGADLQPSGLAEFLIQQGFKGADLIVYCG